MSTEAAMLNLLETREKFFSLPQPFYNDPDFYRVDLEGIFYRRWLLAGFECEIPSVGDYLTLTVGRSPVVVLRDDAGQVRAFFNTCKHRGSKICLEEKGKARKLTCPYHQWTYNLDGKLFYAGRMHDEFDPKSIALKPVHVATVEGQIYVCLADRPPDFAAYRDALTPYLKPYDLTNVKLAHSIDLVENANWKLVVENSRECYHCPARHPQLVETLAQDQSQGYPTLQSNPKIIDFWERCRQAGFPSGAEAGEDFGMSRLRLTDGAASITPDGKHAVAKRLGSTPDFPIGTWRWEHFPSMFAHIFPDYAFFFRLLPLGPEQTLVNAKWLVHKDAVEGRDYDLKNLLEVWDVTNTEDLDLVEKNQMGVNSIGYEPGPYSKKAERSVIKFTEWYCTAMQQHLGGGAKRTRRKVAASGD
jgi:Rieske 2Fe-2S family protein